MRNAVSALSALATRMRAAIALWRLPHRCKSLCSRPERCPLASLSPALQQPAVCVAKRVRCSVSERTQTKRMASLVHCGACQGTHLVWLVSLHHCIFCTRRLLHSRFCLCSWRCRPLKALDAVLLASHCLRCFRHDASAHGARRLSTHTAASRVMTCRR